MFLFYTDGVFYDMSRNVGLGGFERYDLLRWELLVLDVWAIFCLLLFFVGITFHTKKINITLAIHYQNF